MSSGGGALASAAHVVVAAAFLLVLAVCMLSSVALAADLTTVSLPGERLPLAKVADEKIPIPAPMTGALAPNKDLQAATPVFEQILGCKLPAIDVALNLFYCGDEFGAIWQASLLPNGPAPLVLAQTGGRPLSHALSLDGRELFFTDAVRGLLSLDLTQKAKAPLVPIKFLSGYAYEGVSPTSGLTTGAAGPIFFAQGIALSASGGEIYLTDTADAPPALPKKPGAAWNAFGATRANLFSGKPTGRLLKFDRASGKTTVVASGFYVANGIALANDGNSIILNESMSMKVLKVPLNAAGGTNTTVFAMSPGYLDSLSATPAKDGYWVCVFSIANPTLPQFSTAIAAVKPIRSVAGNLPEAVTNVFINRGDGVMKLGNDGTVKGWLEDPNGSVVTQVSGVVQVGSKLLLTAFDGPIKVVDVPAALA